VRFSLHIHGVSTSRFFLKQTNQFSMCFEQTAI
jgi:hypothetical protein